MFESSLGQLVEALGKHMKHSLKLRTPLCGWKHLVHRTRFKRVMAIVDARPSEKILDIGCSGGQFVVEFRNRGAIGLGVDIERSSLTQDIPFINASAFDLPVLSESMDKVFISEVLLSLPDDPVKALREACRVLKPGGRLILPNSKGYKIFDDFFMKDNRSYRFLRRMLGLLIGNTSDTFVRSQRRKILEYLAMHKRHNGNFGEKETVAMVVAAGFENVSYTYELRRSCSFLLGLVLIFKISLGLNGRANVLSWDFWPLYPVLYALERIDRRPGSGVVYVASKRAAHQAQSSIGK